MENHLYRIRWPPLNVTIFITHEYKYVMGATPMQTITDKFTKERIPNQPNMSSQQSDCQTWKDERTINQNKDRTRNHSQTCTMRAHKELTKQKHKLDIAISYCKFGNYAKFRENTPHPLPTMAKSICEFTDGGKSCRCCEFFNVTKMSFNVIGEKNPNLQYPICNCVSLEKINVPFYNLWTFNNLCS